MEHEEMRDRVLGLDDGELPAGERALAEAHLASCAECAGLLERWRRTSRALFRGPAPEGSEAFVRGVLARLPAEAARRPWALPSLPRFALAGAFAAAALTVVLRVPFRAPAGSPSADALAYAGELLDEPGAADAEAEPELAQDIEDYFL